MTYWNENRGSMVKTLEEQSTKELFDIWSKSFVALRKKSVIQNDVSLIYHADTFYATSYVLTHRHMLDWNEYFDALDYNDRWAMRWRPSLKTLKVVA